MNAGSAEPDYLRLTDRMPSSRYSAEFQAATATAILQPIPNPAAGMMKSGTCARQRRAPFARQERLDVIVIDQSAHLFPWRLSVFHDPS